jgi:ABC-2 type transport system ATP-binding protein
VRPSLQIAALTAAYGPRVVLEAISFELAPGEWFVLLGPNGCGKSTLLDCVAGRKVPAAGEVLIAGHSLAQSPFDAKRRLGYGCAQETLPALLTPRQCLEIHAGAKRLTALDADLPALAEELRLTPYLDAFIDTLSLGTRQKVSILLALVGAPDLIVLDEAFNGLDPGSAQIVKRHLRRRLGGGATLLLATHALDIVEHHADRAGLLIDGRLRHQWSADDLARLRAEGRRFEEALAAGMALEPQG